MANICAENGPSAQSGRRRGLEQGGQGTHRRQTFAGRRSQEGSPLFDRRKQRGGGGRVAGTDQHPGQVDIGRLFERFDLKKNKIRKVLTCENFVGLNLNLNFLCLNLRVPDFGQF